MDKDIKLVVLPQEELDQIRGSIIEMQRLIVERKENEAGDEWVESGKARKMLGICQKTWQTYRDRRIIPFSQFGRKIYVKKSDLNSFFEDRYINSKVVREA